MTFTPAELAKLAAGDRVSNMRERLMKRGGVGRLSYDEAMKLQQWGYGREAMAQAAGCTPYTIGKWRQRHGLSRRMIR